jgi:hypothetical protein
VLSLTVVICWPSQAYLGVLRKRFKMWTLSDFHEKVGLPKLNQNYMGMVEQIVASRSEVRRIHR